MSGRPRRLLLLIAVIGVATVILALLTPGLADGLPLGINAAAVVPAGICTSLPTLDSKRAGGSTCDGVRWRDAFAAAIASLAISRETVAELPFVADRLAGAVERWRSRFRSRDPCLESDGLEAAHVVRPCDVARCRDL